MTPHQLPAVIGGKYRPIRVLGQGGMGVVYEVEHLNTGERHALKLMLTRGMLTQDMIERFRREARAASAMKSEHVVRVTDADVAHELDDTPFLVMELLEGRDLERASLEESPSPARVIDWLRQVARTLDKAHRLGIVHRDLKPENLFLADREGGTQIVKVLDFGIAKMASEGSFQTASGQLLGTPRYMAPEQTGDSKEVIPATDRFALGLIAFRLLVGKPYFNEDTVVRLLISAARGIERKPSELGSVHGAEFDEWFARACALKPGDRFESSAEQVESLAAALGLARLSVPASDPIPRLVPADSDPPHPRAVASTPNTLEQAPTLGASVVTGALSLRPSRARTSLWVAAGAAVGLGAMVVYSSVQGERSVTLSSATQPATASAPNVASAASKPEPSVALAPAEPSAPASAAASVEPSITARPSGERRPVTVPSRSPGKAPSTPTTRPKDSVWGAR